MTPIASTYTHIWGSLCSFFWGSVGATDAPLPLLEELPRELQGELHNFMQLKTFCRLSRVSKKLHDRIFSIIARDPLLLSRVLQELIQYGNIAATIEAPLNALSLHKYEEIPIPLSLTVPPDKVPLAEKIAKEFKNIQTLRVLEDLGFGFGIHNQLPIPPCKRLIVNCHYSGFDFAPMPLLTSLKIIDNMLNRSPWSFPDYLYAEPDGLWRLGDGAYVDHRSFWNDGESRSMEQITKFVENRPNGTRYWLLSRYYKEKDPEKCKELLKESLAHFPQCIPAQLDLASYENDAQQLAIYLEVVHCRPDIAEVRVMLAKKLYAFQPDEARFHFEKAIALYEEEEDIDALLDIATFLKSKELAHRIFDPKTPYKKNLYFTSDQLEKIVAIDPTHVFARLQYVTRTDACAQQEVVHLCREQRYLPGLILLSYNQLWSRRDHETACAAREALQELDPELFTIWQHNQNPYEAIHPFVDYFLQKKMSVELLLWPWVRLHLMTVHGPDGIVPYLVKKELQGGTLFDISFLLGDRFGRDKPEIFELLHRLEHQARSNPPDLLETVPEIFGKAFTDKDRWQVFLLLHKHDLYPHLRTQILEEIVKRDPVKMRSISYDDLGSAVIFKGHFLITADTHSDDFYETFSSPFYWNINVHIALAVLLLPEDRTRAIGIFKSVIPFPFLFAIEDHELLMKFEELFAKHSVFPEFVQTVRERTLTQKLSKLSISKK